MTEVRDPVALANSGVNAGDEENFEGVDYEYKENKDLV